MVYEMNNFGYALFAMKVAEADTAKMTWGVHYFSREVSVKSHFGEDCMDHRAIYLVKDIAGDCTCR